MFAEDFPFLPVTIGQRKNDPGKIRETSIIIFLGYYVQGSDGEDDMFFSVRRF